MVSTYYDQTHRLMGITTPLGDNKLLLRGMSGSEHLGRPFQYEVQLASEDPNIALDSLVGENVSIWLDTVDHDTKRFFNGFVSRFSLVDYDNSLAWYEATVVPWLWFLSRTTNCRIFQKMSVPDIIQKVFRDNGFTDFKNSLFGTYEERVHVVQYRETDLDFVSRLMEESGIYYWFSHEDGKHTLVLSDSYSAHGTATDYAEIPFYPPRSGEVHKGAHFDRWVTTRRVQPGAVALDDYDYESPTSNLGVSAKGTEAHAHSKYEVFDYDHQYIERAHGSTLAGIRLEELQARCETCEGHGAVRGLSTGALFSLTEHPVTAQNKEYLVWSASYRLECDIPRDDAPSVRPPVAHVTVQVADSRVPFRPARTTPRPVIQGPQTAVVVGKAGQSIWTDKLGRVKLQFHWDRECPGDENSGCWARVSQNWAGKSWGGMFVPHVGHEVIVEFLEGDPDYPIVTGRVYNGQNSVPLDLPASQETSIISDVAGNKIEMCSTAGKEKITLFSPKETSLFSIGDGCCHQESDGDHILAHKGNREDSVDGNTQHTCGGTKTEETQGNAFYDYLANVNKKISGACKEHVMGILDVKVESPVIKFAGGLTSSTFVGGKHSTFIGGEIAYNKAIKGTFGTSTERNVQNIIKAEGKSSYQIDSPKVVVDGSSSTQIKGKGNVINMLGSKIEIKSGGGAKIVLDGNSIDISCSSICVDCNNMVVKGELQAKKIGKLGF